MISYDGQKAWHLGRRQLVVMLFGRHSIVRRKTLMIIINLSDMIQGVTNFYLWFVTMKIKKISFKVFETRWSIQNTMFYHCCHTWYKSYYAVYQVECSFWLKFVKHSEKFRDPLCRYNSQSTATLELRIRINFWWAQLSNI